MKHLILGALIFGLVACEGDIGPTGSQGPSGATGPQGPEGPVGGTPEIAYTYMTGGFAVGKCPWGSADRACAVFDLPEEFDGYEPPLFQCITDSGGEVYGYYRQLNGYYCMLRKRGGGAWQVVAWADGAISGDMYIMAMKR